MNKNQAARKDIVDAVKHSAGYIKQMKLPYCFAQVVASCVQITFFVSPITYRSFSLC